MDSASSPSSPPAFSVARFVLLPLLTLSLLALCLVYTRSRSRNPFAYPALWLVLLPDVVVSALLIVPAWPAQDDLGCTVFHKAVPLLWMCKSVTAMIAAWIAAKWVVEDHVAHVDMSRRMYMASGVFAALVLGTVCVAVLVLPWFAMDEGVCVLTDARQAGILLALLFAIHMLMFLFVMLQTFLSLSHTLKAMIQATHSLNRVRLGIVSVLVVSAIYMFLQTARYFIWMVLVLTLNMDVYRKQAMAGHSTFVSRVERANGHVDAVLLWLDVLGLLVLVLQLPKPDDFLAVDRREGWDAERQFRKMSVRPPPVVVTAEPFVTQPSDKRDDVLFVAPSVPSSNRWSGMLMSPSTPTASPSAKDAKLLQHDTFLPDIAPPGAHASDTTTHTADNHHHHQNNHNNDTTVFDVDPAMQDDFSAFKRQSTIAQANMFAGVSAMPSIEEQDDESLDDVLMSDDGDDGGGGERQVYQHL